MDRANDIRSMMKMGGKVDGNSNLLSGKDKAKALKLMREQQKQKETINKTNIPRPPITKEPQSNKPQYQTGLPPGFFDDNVTPLSSKASNQTNQSHNLANAPAVPAQSNKQTNGAAGISNLPAGFFDNPVEDLNARGITMEQYTASMEKEEQSELNSFLTEIKGTTPIQTGYGVFLLCRRHMQYYYFEHVLLFDFYV